MKKILPLIVLLPLCGLTLVKYARVSAMKNDPGRNKLEKLVKDSVRYPLPANKLNSQSCPRLWSPQFLSTQPYWFLQQGALECPPVKKAGC